MKTTTLNYGAISVWTQEATFFQNGYYKNFLRNGVVIATAHYTPDGKRDRLEWLKTCSAPVELTRAQGFRYWSKYFPDRTCYSLPEVLEEAINKPCTSEGVFYSKKYNELIGYAG